MLFKFNSSMRLNHPIEIDPLVFQKGIDEVLIEIKNIKDQEEYAAYRIYFVPIAGDYSEYIKDVVGFSDGTYEGNIGYITAIKSNIVNEFRKQSLKEN